MQALDMALVLAERSLDKAYEMLPDTLSQMRQQMKSQLTTFLQNQQQDMKSKSASEVSSLQEGASGQAADSLVAQLEKLGQRQLQ